MRRPAVYGRGGRMQMGRTAIRPVRTVRRPAIENGGGCVQAGRRTEAVRRIEVHRIEVHRIEVRCIEQRRAGHVLTLIFTTLGSSIAKPNLNGPLAQLDASGELLAYVRVRILRQLEDLLQFDQLHRRECGATFALLSLNLDARLRVEV